MASAIHVTGTVTAYDERREDPAPRVTRRVNFFFYTCEGDAYADVVDAAFERAFGEEVPAKESFWVHDSEELNEVLLEKGEDGKWYDVNWASDPYPHRPRDF